MKFIQSIIILLISMVLHKCYCSSHNDKSAEILKYCRNNGHKYVAILNEDASQFKPYSLLLNSIDIRGRFVTLDNLDTLVGNLDFLIVEKSKSLKFAEIFQIMNVRTIQKSLLVINEGEIQEFKMAAKAFAKNSYFYLFTTSFTSNFKWYTIMTLNNSSQLIMNQIQFNDLGQAVEDFNMNGYNIVGAALPWKPFIDIQNCDITGRNCQVFGIIPDMMDIWAKVYNFTWDTYREVNNDWGYVDPVEGPHNGTGGVMGDVFNGRYQVSLDSWHWKKERYFVDFVPFSLDRMILCLAPKFPEVDTGLFIRPFRNDVWKCIGIFVGCGLAILFIPYLFLNGWDNMKANYIIQTSLWMFFFMVNSYYGGALTMFFVSEFTIPFNTLRDVLQVFPEWNLVFVKGYDPTFQIPADLGDPDYLKYWNYVQLEGRYEEYAMADISAGIKEITRKSQTILMADESLIKGEYIENPKSFPAIKTFGGAKPYYGCFIFTKNSPLLPMFRRAATQLIESGQYLRIDSKWKGSKIPEEGVVEKLILTVGQTFLVFVFFLFSLSTSLILLSIECCHNFYKKYTGPVL